MTPEEVIDHYRASLGGFKPSTRENYCLHARKLAEWRLSHDASFPDMTDVDVSRYLDYREKEVGNAESTVRAVLYGLRHFFNWAVERGLITTSPARSIAGGPPRAKPRDTLTLAELRAIWDAAPTPMHRAVVGLLGMTGMRPEEVLSLSVTDLVKTGDYFGFALPSRKSVPINSFALLSPEVLAAVRVAIGARRTGPLLIRADGKRLDRRTADRWVKSAAKRAGISIRVSQLTLTFTMRAISIAHGFSYVGVVRAIGEVHPTKGQRWFVNAPNPQEEHAALRLCRLVFNDPDSSLGILSEASICLNQTDLPPAIAAAVAGAALEKHVRDLCLINEIVIDMDETKRKLGTYITHLRRHGHISSVEVQRMQAVQGHRDNAAHGWFDRVTVEQAQWAIRECRSFIDSHPLP